MLPADAAITGIACAITFAVVVAGVHWDRRELNPLATSLSTYFTGSTRVAMFVAYSCLAIALVCVASVVAISGHGVPLGGLSAALCALSAIALIPIGLTARRQVGDPDVRQPMTVTMHRGFALAAFIMIVAGMMAFAYGEFALGANTKSTVLVECVSVVAGLNLALVLVSRPGPTYGLKQKTLVLLVLLWIAAVSTQLTLWPNSL